jgi:hypothetical protein
MASLAPLRSTSSPRIPGRWRGPASHVRLVDWCADLGVLTTAFHPGPSIAVGVAFRSEQRTGNKEPRPAAQQAVAAGRSRRLQLGTCAHRAAPSFLVVSTISKGFAAERQAVRRTGVDRGKCSVDYNRFYQQLFTPLTGVLGPVDAESIAAIIGFDAGGPLNFCTIGAGRGPLVSYVSCELAVREDQMPASFGRYELLATCDDEGWARSVLTDIGRMSLEVGLDDGHTIDLGPSLEEGASIQGVVLEQLYATEIAGASYGVLRAIGVTRAELNHAQDHDVRSLVQLLKEHGAHPATRIGRHSVL